MRCNAGTTVFLRKGVCPWGLPHLAHRAQTQELGGSCDIGHRTQIRKRRSGVCPWGLPTSRTARRPKNSRAVSLSGTARKSGSGDRAFARGGFPTSQGVSDRACRRNRHRGCTDLPDCPRRSGRRLPRRERRRLWLQIGKQTAATLRCALCRSFRSQHS